MSIYLEKIKVTIIQYKIVIISTFAWGLLAHGYMFFNKLSFFDDVTSLTSVGATYSSGRWFLGILGAIISKLFHGCYSVPLLIGILTLVMLSVVNVLLTSIFKIQNELSCVILGGLLVVFPAMTALYSFMFTSGYYVFSILLAVLAVYAVTRCEKSVVGISLSILCIALSMGIYQSNVGFSALCFIFLIIFQAMDEQQTQVKDLFKTGVTYVVCLLGGLGAYLALNKVFLAINAVELNTYRGISSMYSREVLKLDFRYLLETFLNINDDLWYFSVYVENTAIVYDIVLLFIGIYICYGIFRLVKKKKIGQAVLLLLATACIPIALNPFALINTDMVSSLVLLPKVLVFVFFVALIEKQQVRRDKIKKVILVFGSFILLYANVYYVYFANRCYLTAELHRFETVSWMTTLVTQIKSLEGFDEQMKIAYLNKENLDDSTFVCDKRILTDEERFYIGDIRKHYTWKVYLKEWCGFEMEEVDAQTYDALLGKDEVVNMKSYPNYGSIQIIDGIIVVKF